jgi:hypothetical protein
VRAHPLAPKRPFPAKSPPSGFPGRAKVDARLVLVRFSPEKRTLPRGGPPLVLAGRGFSVKKFPVSRNWKPHVRDSRIEDRGPASIAQGIMGEGDRSEVLAGHCDPPFSSRPL